MNYIICYCIHFDCEITEGDFKSQQPEGEDKHL